MYNNILEIIEEKKDKIPSHIAICDNEGEISYKELCRLSQIIGSNLYKKLKVTKRPIAVMMDKSYKSITAFWGVVYSGNFYVCIDVNMGESRIEKILDTLSPAACISQKPMIEKWKWSFPVFDYEELITGTQEEGILRAIRLQSISTDPLYILFTSGSTGIPKGTVVSHSSVIAYAEWVVNTFKLDQETIFGNQTPFYFSMSVLDIYATIYSGATLNIIPKKWFSFPIRLLEYIENNKINTIYWVPSALSIVANWKAFDYIKVTGLKKILFAGEVMPTKQLNVWRRHLPDALYANLFGPTEITDIGLYYILDRDFRDDQPLPIGKPCLNMDAFAIDESGTKLEKGDGKVGELYFRGNFLAYGYWKNTEKTSEAFVQNPLQSDYPETVYRTGDLVKISETGEFYYVGRKDFQIKHMGNRIELGEIETAANSVIDVDMAVCIFDPQKDRIKLIFQGRQKEDVIKQILETKLPTYMIPNDIIKVQMMRLNANGKIDRKELEKIHIGEKR